jgi:hypothetical protein
LNASDAIRLVVNLRKEGVSFWADSGGNICVRPAGLLTPDHRTLLIQNKPAVVAWLRQYAAEHCPSDDELRRRGWLPGDRKA